MRYVFLGLALVLVACNPGDRTVEKLDCPSVKNIETVLNPGDPKIIIIGEIHGMEEPPKLAAAMVCHSLNAGYKTTLALEIDDREGAHQVFVESQGFEKDVEDYFRDETWTTPFVDGRSSQAMFDLIDYGRSISKQTDLSFTWFRTIDYSLMPEGDRSARNQNLEEQMASAILKSVEKNQAEKTIVLVGNLHARTDKAQRGDVSYDYMAKHLVGHGLMTFDTIHAGGTSWNCRGYSITDCKEYKSGGYYKTGHSLIESDEFEILLNGDERLQNIRGHYSPDVFHGAIHLGKVSASSPANPDGRQELKEDE